MYPYPKGETVMMEEHICISVVPHTSSIDSFVGQPFQPTEATSDIHPLIPPFHVASVLIFSEETASPLVMNMFVGGRHCWGAHAILGRHLVDKIIINTPPSEKIEPLE